MWLFIISSCMTMTMLFWWLATGAEPVFHCNLSHWPWWPVATFCDLLIHSVTVNGYSVLLWLFCQWLLLKYSVCVANVLKWLLFSVSHMQWHWSVYSESSYSGSILFWYSLFSVMTILLTFYSVFKGVIVVFNVYCLTEVMKLVIRRELFEKEM